MILVPDQTVKNIDTNILRCLGYSKKFHKTDRKTLVLEPLFNKVLGGRPTFRSRM